MIKDIFNTIATYKHLFNPLATLNYKGDSPYAAPVGKLRLAKENKTNLALWNALFVGGGLLPLAFLANTLANKKHESEVEDAMDNALLEKLNAQRPRLVAGSRVGDMSAFTKLPKKELQQLEELKNVLYKDASGDGKDDDGRYDKIESTVNDVLHGVVGNTAKDMLPLLTIPTATLSAIGLSNYIQKNRNIFFRTVFNNFLLF